MAMSTRKGPISEGISPDLVKVTFRLYHLSEEVFEIIDEERSNGNNVEIALLGSIRELGKWNLRERLIAKKSLGEKDVWEVESYLPPCSNFEISWLIADTNRVVVHWDPSEEHSVKLAYNEMIVQVSWGRDPTYLISRTCSVVAQCHYSCLMGENLAVVGSAPCLGSWDPNHGILAEEFPRGSGTWMASLQLSPGGEYEWKWIVLDYHTKYVKRWEESPNRFIATNCHRVHLVAPWDAPVTVKSHSSAIHQEIIDMNKVARFYDAMETADAINLDDMRYFATNWRTRQKTTEKPYVSIAPEKKLKIQN